VGGYLLWRWFFSSSLDYTRVGPRPAEGGQVVVLLHGFGVAGDDLVGLAEQLSAGAPGTTFLLAKGPHRVGITGRAWLPRLSARSREELATLEAAEVDKTSRQLWDLI
jgi:predicted esterase